MMPLEIFSSVTSIPPGAWTTTNRSSVISRCADVPLVVAKYGVGQIPPILFTFLRFAIVAAVLLPVLKIHKGQMRAVIFVAVATGGIHFALIYTGLALAAFVAAMAPLLDGFATAPIVAFFAPVQSPLALAAPFLIALMTQPVMPESSAKLLDQLAVPENERRFATITKNPALQPGTPLPKPQGVFPRIQMEEEGG